MEAWRTRDDWVQMSPGTQGLAARKKLLAGLAGCKVQDLEDAAKALPATAGTSYPEKNRFLTLFEDADDVFDIVWCRLAFKRHSNVPTGKPDDDADLWYLLWKGTDPDPKAVKAAFARGAREVDALLAKSLTGRRASAATVSVCKPTDATALAIRNACEDLYEGNKTDCKDFARAVVSRVTADAVSLPGATADDVVDGLGKSSDWSVTKDIAEAIKLATGGSIVVAGATSTELGGGRQHGHLAIVVGCPGDTSGTGTSAVKVPIGFAGSIDAGGRLAGGRISGSFPQDLVREGKVRYFSRTVPLTT